MATSTTNELIKYTLDRLKEIDSTYEKQSDKSSQFNKMAKKIHKALAGTKKKPTPLNSYESALSRIRHAVVAANYKHHGLTATTKREGYLEWVIAKLPQYESDLRSIATLPALTIGDGINDLYLKAKSEMTVDQRKAVKLKDTLKSKFLYIHPLVVMLYLDEDSTEQRGADGGASLLKKSTNMKVYNVPALLAKAELLLTDKSYSAVSWAIALLTGRRAAEVLYHAEFTKTASHKVLFKGQLKKRAGTDTPAYVIPTLISADKIIKALKHLRSMDEVKALRGDTLDLDGEELKTSTMTARNFNRAINQRCSGVLNSRAKSIMGDKKEVFKNTRNIYARQCLDTVWNNDSEWNGINEDQFLKAILGHQSVNEIKHYRQVELKHDDAEWLKIAEVADEEKSSEPKEKAKQNWRATSPIKAMRDSLDNFGADHVEMKGRKVAIKSLVEFHDTKLRFWVAENSGLKITQSAIEKNKGNTLASGTGSVDVRVNRLTFQAWVAVVGKDALDAYNNGKD